MTATVLVTGVGGRSVGAGILHALMRTDTTVRARWRTLATDCDPFSWGLYVADAAALLPAAGASGYVDRLAELIDAHDVMAVIPGTEAEAELLAAQRAALMPLMSDKRQVERRLAQLGLRSIPSYPWARRQAAASAFGFPLAVKPTRGTGGSRGVHLVTCQRELEALVPRVDPRSRPIVQPYIGDPEEEYTVGVLSDSAGTIIDSIVIRRKLIGLSLLDARRCGRRTVAISTGISQGYVVRDAAIQGFCERLARSLESRGPLNLQLRVHQGEPYVFEIHPRFSGTTAIRASVGFNEPDILLRHHLHGERFGRLDYSSEVAAIRAFEHVLVPIDEMLPRERRTPAPRVAVA